MGKPKNRAARKPAPPEAAGPEPYLGDRPPARILSKRGLRWLVVLAIPTTLAVLLGLLIPATGDLIAKKFGHDEPIIVNIKPQKPRPQESSPPASPDPRKSTAQTIATSSIARKIRGGQWNWELCLWTVPSTISGDSVATLTDIIAQDGPVTDPFFRDTRAWVYAHGGADGGVSYFRITLQGTKHDVVINNIQADVVSRGKPQTGTLLLSKSEGGAAVSQQRLNLDKAQPKVDYFADHYITIKKGESQVIDLTAYTRKYFIAWNLQVDMVVDGNELSLFIDSNGETHRAPGQGNPFHTSALLPLDKYESSHELTVENPDAWVPLQETNYSPRYTDVLLDPDSG